MAAQALPLALLLAGEMPRDVEQIFAACKLTLFPKSYGELRASCSCPDWENPCKHVAAAYCILAERFDEDPFLIFACRGRSKEELLGRLRARRDRAGWRCGPELAGFRVSPLAGEVPDALLRQLGPAPAEVRGRNAAELLAPVYTKLTQHAEHRALGR